MRRHLVLPLIFFASVLAACSSSDEVGGASSSSGSPGRDPLANARPVVDQYAKNLYLNYVECRDKARALQRAIDAFVATPSATTHEEAKAAWIAARVPYALSEAHRFYGGPIDDIEGEINAWPLDENFIDYTRDDPDAGIINHPELVPEITKAAIARKNEEGGEKNIATGFHAIEFLLWGQDTDEPEAKTAGKRPYTDYLTTGGTAKNQARRGQYLKVVAELLADDLEKVAAAWEPGKENYATTFPVSPRDAITKMLTGMGALANAELSGERMTVAYKNRGQEDEHSCFSDTTDADLLGDFVGIQNVYLGKYGESDGPGIDELVHAVDPALDTQMKSDLDAGVAALQAMQSVPFDLAIASPDGSLERRNVLEAIKAVKKAANTVVLIGQKLGANFKLEEPSQPL